MILGSRSLIRATQLDIAVARYLRPRVSLIINGFWRSGTTWLLESVARATNTKTIFEPMSAETRDVKEILRQLGLVEHNYQNACIPGPDLIRSPIMLEHLDASFYGRRWNHFQRQCRRRILESTSRRIVVKGVRFHFGLSMLGQRYRAPIIHIRRHPCAVIASLSKVKWSWSFDFVRLSKLLEVSLSGSPAEVYRRAEIAMRKFDEDIVSRWAAYWAVAEWIAQLQVTQAESARVVWYEDLMDDPRRSIQDLCSYSGLAPKHSFDYETDSVVTSEGSKGIQPADRRNAWRSQMADEDVKKILSAIEKIFPELNLI